MRDVKMAGHPKIGKRNQPKKKKNKSTEENKCCCFIYTLSISSNIPLLTLSALALF
jgi:hypothetical protein